MRRTLRTLSAAVALSAIAAALSMVTAPAQQVPPPAGTRPAEEVLAQLGQSAGVVILTDSTIFARLPAAARTATPATVEQQLTELVAALPAGASWVKLYVPAPANGRWNGDLVADYARAQARLLGTAGRPAPAGTVDLFGRPVPADKANEYITGLNLKLVYLVTNPRAPSAANVASEWSRLAPEQRDQYVQQQAQRVLSLDPASRLAMLRQMMRREPTAQDMIMRQVMSRMTDEERVQLKQSLADEKKIDERRVIIGK